MSATEKSNFTLGYEHYRRGEYEKAVWYFTVESAMGVHPSAMMWLGWCYECGLGIGKDLQMAKNLYISAHRYSVYLTEQNIAWLKERLALLKDIPEIKEYSTFIEGIGNVKVIGADGKNTYRYNLNETVITISGRDPLCKGFVLAERDIPDMNKAWTCDGKSRFHDGYTLNTDFFDLSVRRGNSDRYVGHIDGRRCTLYFPVNANLDYIYVQESILKQVQDLLFKRAKVVLPEVLEDVSRRINVPYSKCEVIKKLRSSYATFNIRENIVTVRAQCVQLPREQLEALCVHELTHTFHADHSASFYRKMAELAGEEIVRLDKRLFEEGRWPYIRF